MKAQRLEYVKISASNAVVSKTVNRLIRRDLAVVSERPVDCEHRLLPNHSRTCPGPHSPNHVARLTASGAKLAEHLWMYHTEDGDISDTVCRKWDIRLSGSAVTTVLRLHALEGLYVRLKRPGRRGWLSEREEVLETLAK